MRNLILFALCLLLLSMNASAEDEEKEYEFNLATELTDSYLRCYYDSRDTFVFSIRNVTEEDLKDRESLIRTLDAVMDVCIDSLKRDARYYDKLITHYVTRE